MKVTFDEYLDSIANGARFQDDLTETEIASERIALRARVLAHLERQVTPKVLNRWKTTGMDVPASENPGFEVSGQV
jgi:hypothetical protein